MAEQTVERKDPVYLLTIGYVLALTIIAVMSLCIHVVIGQVVDEQNNAAIVVSARQAKLSQKIAFYATQYVEYRDLVFKEQLEDSLALMKSSHEVLIKGDEGMKVSSLLSEELDRVYFSLPYNLDTRMNDFVTRADAFLATNPEKLNRESQDYKYVIETAKGSLVMALDAATLEYEAESEQRLGKLQSYQKMALFVIFATLIAEASLIFKPLVTRVHNYADRLKRMAMTDSLTGVDNGRAFTQKAMKELKRCKRHGKPLCVAILDIDHFKRVNDEHGHLVGDAVLKIFAQFSQRSMRLEDEFARIGGEEFAILLPHTNLVGAELVTERIRNIIEISPIRYDTDKELYITASIGVAEFDPDAVDIESAMDCADQALYKAKQQGRNKVVCSDSYCSDGNVVRLGRPGKS